MLDEDCASCAICSQWPRALREEMRRAIDELPLSKQVCSLRQVSAGVLGHAVGQASGGRS